MIVPMKKIYIVMQSRDAHKALGVLRDEGVVHIENVHVPAGNGLSEIKAQIALLSKAVDIVKGRAAAGQDIEKAHWLKYANEIVDLDSRAAELREEVLRLQNDIDRWEPWGDLDPKDILALQKKGIPL